MPCHVSWLADVPWLAMMCRSVLWSLLCFTLKHSMTFKDAHLPIPSVHIQHMQQKYLICAESSLSAWRTCIRTVWAASRFSSCHMTPSFASHPNLVGISQYGSTISVPHFFWNVLWHMFFQWSSYFCYILHSVHSQWPHVVPRPELARVGRF